MNLAQAYAAALLAGSRSRSLAAIELRRTIQHQVPVRWAGKPLAPEVLAEALRILIPIRPPKPLPGRTQPQPRVGALLEKQPA